MSAAVSPKSDLRLTAAVLTVLWLHFFWCLIPSWDSNGYYSYGWLVAPVAFAFAWRRISALGDNRSLEPNSQKPGWPAWVFLVLFLLLLPVLRMVEIADPGWRPPILLHAAGLVFLSHFTIAWKAGWKRSAYFAPVTVFALSAVPYPWQIEQALIRKLTGTVIHISGELFNLTGRPVTVIGEKLESMGTMVEVTEGCSGIRSFQSLIMAALFFGELFRLHWFPRLLLVAVGIAASVVMNTGRAMTLAHIRFDQGEAAFDSAHDSVGYMAFGISALVLLAIAKLMNELSDGGRKVVRTTTTATR